MPNQQVKRPQLIASYAAGILECGSLGGPMKQITVVKFAEVYYYQEFPKRLWIYVKGESAGGDYILGEDETCHFTGARSSPLN